MIAFVTQSVSPLRNTLKLRQWFKSNCTFFIFLAHSGRVKHICVSKSTIIDSDNDLSSGRHQFIISTNVGILLIGPSGTIFSENLIEIHTFSFTQMHLKMSSGKWWPCCLGLNVLTTNFCAKPERGHAQNVIYWRPFQRTLVRANKVIRENGQLSIGADDYFFSKVFYRVPQTIICWSHGQLFVPADIFCSQGENLFDHSHLPTLSAKKATRL